MRVLSRYLPVRAGLLSGLVLTSVAAAGTINLGHQTPRYEGVVAVVDADATDGVAFKSVATYSGIVHCAYSWEIMGVFEAAFRLKVADNTVAGTVATLRYNCETTRFRALPPAWSGRRAIKGTDFKAANTYQEFTVRWLAPHQGRNGWVVAVTGATEVWVDAIEVKRVKAITEEELIKYLPNARPIPDPTPRQGPLRAHITRGFFSDYYMLDLVLARIPGVRVTSSSWRTGGGAARYPEAPRALYAQDLLVLAGTDIQHIGIAQRPALRKWVEAGGGLFVLGGPVSFGQAALTRSVIADLLPVEMTGGFDLKRDKIVFAAAPGAEGHAVLTGIDLRSPMVALFRHHVKVKPNATVVIGTAEKPLLVVWDVGKGRVACFLSAPMGRADEAAEGETVFWNDARLPVLFANVARYLMPRTPPKSPYTWTSSPKPTAAAAAVIARLDSGGLDGDDMDLDDLEDDGDDLDTTAGGGDKPLAMSAADRAVLLRGGGKPGVDLLLRHLPTMSDECAIQALIAAVRPHVGPEHFDRLLALSKDMAPLAIIKESAVSLLGKSDRKRAAVALRGYRGTTSPRLQRALCRSILEGRLRSYLPYLKRIHPGLKSAVEDRRLRKYEGYWFDGVKADDPVWAYAECTMALLAMGEPGYMADACHLLYVLHIQDLKIRSFIFLYNPKVPREAKASELHHRRNAFVGPDLMRLLVRFEAVLATLPDALHGEFREAFLAIDDAEKLQRLLYPMQALMTGGGAGWAGARPVIDEHAFRTVINGKRF